MKHTIDNVLMHTFEMTDDEHYHITSNLDDVLNYLKDILSQQGGLVEVDMNTTELIRDKIGSLLYDIQSSQDN